MNRNATPADWRYASHSEEQTAQLGAALAEALQPGLVVALIGGLGAGKTRLVRAVAVAAGVDRREVSSPTFVLIQEYEGRLPIYHVDTYRLAGEEEFLDLGADEYLQGGGVCFIEWADRVVGVLPADVLTIDIRITGETTRELQFSAAGPVSREALKAVQQQFA